MKCAIPLFLILAVTWTPGARGASDTADIRELAHLRSDGRLDEAEAVARRLRADPKAAVDVAAYELYDRGRCEEAAALAPQTTGGGLREDEIRFDIEICRAARVDAHDPSAAEVILKHATMLGDEFGFKAFGSFGRFAASTSPDSEILQFLHRKDFDRTTWPLRRAMGQHLLKLHAVAVDRLLEAGVNPNLPIYTDRRLPLQIVRSHSQANEAAAIATARALIDHGADPNMLAWFRDEEGKLGTKGTDGMEALLREAAGKLDPVRVDFLRAVQVKVGTDKPRGALRIRIGNASKKPVPVTLWRAGDQLMCGLNVVEFEYRPPHFEKWLKPSPSIEDGSSPPPTDIAPGEAREFLCEMDTREAPLDSEGRVLVYFHDGSKRYSGPFQADERWAVDINIPAFEQWK